jgi:WD40 repeat protein
LRIGCSPSTAKTPHHVSAKARIELSYVLDLNLFAEARAETTTPSTEIRLTGSKATVAIWAPLSDYILTGHENGKVAKYDAKTGEEVEAVEGSHSREITDIQLSPDGTYFITCSRDRTARVSVWPTNSCMRHCTIG